jgi:histidinol-phosphate aminotransferase
MDLQALARPEILALKPYASARALAGDQGILLNANESPWPPPGHQSALNRYPAPQPPALKRALAEQYGVAPEQLLITRGSDEGIDLLVRVFCQAGQDRVVICPPCFGLYALSAKVQGAGVTEIPLEMGETDWAVNWPALDAERGAKLVFLCSPNNPTGSGCDAVDVLALAQRMTGHGLVVMDEAYIEYSARDSLAALVAEQANLVVLRTLSKAHALAGCRLGVVIADPCVIDLLRRIIAPYPLPTPAVEAAMMAMTPDALAETERRIAVLAEEKQRLMTALEAHPGITQLWPGEANFILVRACNGASLMAAAAAAGIVLRDQSTQPGLDQAVRITVGTPDENQALLQCLQQWSP